MPYPISHRVPSFRVNLFFPWFKADWENESKKPPKEWPQSGVVEFREYETCYRKNLEPVLKGISCHIKAGEKVGTRVFASLLSAPLSIRVCVRA